MSASMNHSATEHFLERHGTELRGEVAAGVYARLALRALEIEGRSPAFEAYLRRARSAAGFAAAHDRWIIRALSSLWGSWILALGARLRRAWKGTAI